MKAALRSLKVSLYRPERLIVALGVAVATLFVLTLSWLSVNRIAKQKVNSVVASVSKKLDLPVEIGRWRLGLGTAHFEDIVIGGDANLLVSQVTAEVNLNPFSGEFGNLDTVTVHRIRLKAGIDKLRGQMARLSEPDTADSDPLTDAPRTIAKLFAAMPTRKLMIAGGTFTVTDTDGEPFLTVRGLKLLVDRAATKILVKSDSVKTRDGFADTHLQGRFELKPGTDSYRFFVRRKATIRGKPAAANAWSLLGEMKKDLSAVEVNVAMRQLPTFLAKPLAPYLGAGTAKGTRAAISGKIVAVRQGSPDRRLLDADWSFDARLISQGLKLTAPILSSQPIGPVRFDVAARGRVKGRDRILAIEHASVDVPRRDGRGGQFAQPLQLTFSGAGRLPTGGPLDQGAFEANLHMPAVDCQAILDASPAGLLPALTEFKVGGTATATVALRFDGRRPEDVYFDMRGTKFGCRVLSAPYVYSAEHLSGPFTLMREVGKEDEPQEINVSPLSPGYTPLASIARNVNLAFTTSEDTAFWQHNGIDAAAIESAFRRNLVEKRVAVGGSTITMQVVKNLFLTHERTITRKLQELFLAWHLDNVLPKERILEIYMNVAELGPGIYGVTQAAEHYFAKHPFDLNLLESAYLAQLLPAPKARYRYFCNGQMSPAFRDMVVGLLRRMTDLDRISGDRYAQAANDHLVFNEEARMASHQCTRRTQASVGE